MSTTDTNIDERRGLIERLHRGRLAFLNHIAANLGYDHYKKAISVSNGAGFAIAEFLYLLELNDLKSSEGILAVGEAHNAALDALTEDDAKKKRIGRNAGDIKAARFSPRGLKKLVENFKHRPPSFDQSDLSRLLAMQLSTENCRRVIKILVDLKLLESWDSPFGSVIVFSPGTLERAYGLYLDEIMENKT